MTNNIQISSPSDSLNDLVEKAVRKILIVAPYIKSTALSKIIPMVPKTVEEFTCITRWLPADIASGACDIEIYDKILTIEGGKLFVNPLLHAKFYSNDESVLIGSANLTLRGLGLCIPSNLELIIKSPRNIPGLKEWEGSLLNSAIEVTDELRDKIQLESNAIEFKDRNSCIQEVETPESSKSLSWIPKCIVPERLWDVYVGGGKDDMVTNSYIAAIEDLKILPIPTGLDRAQFEEYVRVILSQLTIFKEIDKMSIEGLTDETAMQVLTEHTFPFTLETDPEQSWKVLKNWLLYFYPEHYRTQELQHVFIKGKKFIKYRK